MKKAVWLSYDLGIGGDYTGLYEWLDELKAKECGDSLAFFEWENNNPDDIANEIKKSLIDSGIEFNEKKNRVYLIYRDKDNKVKGVFLFGKRKANAWEGYAPKTMQEVDG